MMAFVDIYLCPQRRIVDTLVQATQATPAKVKKRRRTIKEKRDIVEETTLSGASVARVARRHDVNANRVFYWRKLFREGRPGISTNPQLLPVTVETEQATEPVKSNVRALSPGTMEIAFPSGNAANRRVCGPGGAAAMLESLAR